MGSGSGDGGGGRRRRRMRVFAGYFGRRGVDVVEAVGTVEMEVVLESLGVLELLELVQVEAIEDAGGVKAEERL